MENIFIVSFVCVLILNITAYLIAYFKQTDHLTDITYSISFIAVAVIGFRLSPVVHYWKSVLLFMIIIWAIRLGGYLFLRIRKMKVDNRFDEMRSKPLSYLGFWIIQSLSIYVLSLPVIAFFTIDLVQQHWTLTLGFIIWLIGFLFETLADYQKSKFKIQEKNKGQFISSGLWKFVRYPNYLGEILCWVGIFVFVSGNISGLLWLSVLSPIWIIILLVFISGIPLLEDSSSKKYGHLEEYKKYKANTYRLIPFIW